MNNYDTVMSKLHTHNILMLYYTSIGLRAFLTGFIKI